MKTVGIIGGGQLGMMLAEEIHNLGAKAICLDPNPKCSASFVCDDIVVSKYDDLEGLKKLGDMSDVLESGRPEFSQCLRSYPDVFLQSLQLPVLLSDKRISQLVHLK